MLASLDSAEFVTLLVIVALASFFFTQFIDAVLGADGFGQFFTIAILVAGTFGGLYLAQIYQLPSGDYILQAVCGVGGAFGTLICMMIFKMTMRRLGF